VEGSGRDRLMMYGKAGKAESSEITVQRHMGSIQQLGFGRRQDTKAKGAVPGWSILLTSPGFWHQM
jgi:hypothetical protein